MCDHIATTCTPAATSWLRRDARYIASTLIKQVRRPGSAHDRVTLRETPSEEGVQEITSAVILEVGCNGLGGDARDCVGGTGDGRLRARRREHGQRVCQLGVTIDAGKHMSAAPAWLGSRLPGARGNGAASRPLAPPLRSALIRQRSSPHAEPLVGGQGVGKAGGPGRAKAATGDGAMRRRRVEVALVRPPGLGIADPARHGRQFMEQPAQRQPLIPGTFRDQRRRCRPRLGQTHAPIPSQENPHAVEARRRAEQEGSRSRRSSGRLQPMNSPPRCARRRPGRGAASDRAAASFRPTAAGRSRSWRGPRRGIRCSCCPCGRRTRSGR
jgi:hypothetical protein